jgi:hypothetical protein
MFSRVVNVLSAKEMRRLDPDAFTSAIDAMGTDRLSASVSSLDAGAA